MPLSNTVLSEPSVHVSTSTWQSGLTGYFTLQSSYGEANGRSVARQIPYILWNKKVHYRVHNSSPLYLILRQTNQIHNIALYFLRSHFPIPSSTPRSLRWHCSIRQHAIRMSLTLKNVRMKYLMLFSFNGNGINFVSPFRAISIVWCVLC